MKMSLRLLAVVSMLVLGFTMAACEMSESCDPATDPNCEVVDAGTDQTTDTVSDQPQYQTYHYVLIQDLDSSPRLPHPGADIDGVELSKGGVSYYLARIEEGAYGTVPPEDGSPNDNFNNALGRPQGTCVGRDDSQWDENTFVSLGGTGGYLIGSFTDLVAIETGNELTVHTCSDSASEDWRGSVGVADTLSDPDWFIVMTGVGVSSVTIPNLPNVEMN